MLARVAGLRREGPGGVLIKARKPNQDVEIDLPSIGPRTVDLAHKAGLRGIAVEAGGSLVLGLEIVTARADTLGLFVIGGGAGTGGRDPMSEGQGAPEAPLLYLIAGEPSGDMLGAALMRALKSRLGGQVRFAGIGGDQMTRRSISTRIAIRELAIMGILEVLPSARRILRFVARRSTTFSGFGRWRSSPSIARGSAFASASG